MMMNDTEGNFSERIIVFTEKATPQYSYSNMTDYQQSKFFLLIGADILQLPEI